jgi:hypothetical protein
MSGLCEDEGEASRGRAPAKSPPVAMVAYPDKPIHQNIKSSHPRLPLLRLVLVILLAPLRRLATPATRITLSTGLKTRRYRTEIYRSTPDIS